MLLEIQISSSSSIYFLFNLCSTLFPNESLLIFLYQSVGTGVNGRSGQTAIDRVGLERGAGPGHVQTLPLRKTEKTVTEKMKSLKVATPHQIVQVTQ